MTLQGRISALATLIGADYKSLVALIGTMSALATTNKTTIVGAINEVLALANTGGASAVIDDTANAGANKTYSIDKIKQQVAQLKSEILGGLPNEAFDTLKELSDYALADGAAMTAFTTAMALRVRVDAAQAFSSPQQLQARQNIDAFGTPEIGNPDTDFVSVYNTAKA